MELAKRNLKEAVRDPLSLGVSIIMPSALFVIFQVALGDVSPVFEATSLAPGMAQAAVVFVIGLFLGLEVNGSILWVVLVLVLMATWHIAMGMIIGSLFPYKAVSGVWAPLLILTILGGTWMDLEEIGGVLQTIGGVLPFAHAIDATRAVMADGAGFGDISTDLMWVGGYTIGVVVIAIVVFRRKMVE
jgi:ABC-2 type transport system permease protein